MTREEVDALATIIQGAKSIVVVTANDRRAELGSALIELIANALTAAAEVGPRCLVTGNLFGTDTWMEGHPCQCAVCQAELNKHAAAEVDLRPSDYIEAGYRKAVADTIERCAQVADKYEAVYGFLVPREIAAAIRALKDKP